MKRKIALVRITNNAFLKHIISHSFEGDKELLDKFHVLSDASFERVVDYTYDQIVKTSLSYELEYYGVWEHQNEYIGYTVVRKEPTAILYSFGINIERRNKDVLVEWLQRVEELLGTEYKVPVWAKNQRVIDFFTRNNFKVHKKNDYTVTMCLNNNKKS